MSSAAMKWARRQSIEHRGLVHLVATLAAAADARGQSWRAQGTLADQMAVSVRSVRLWLLALERLGVIQRIGRSRGRGLGRSSDLVRLRLDRQFTLTREAVRAILQPAKAAACNANVQASDNAATETYNRQTAHLQPANAAGDKVSDQQKVVINQGEQPQDHQSAQRGKAGLRVLDGGRAA
jgi:hypothetical protein